MSLGAFVVLAALFGAFLAVSRRWLSADLALMAGLSVVTIAGILEPKEAVLGFASTAVVAVASLYVILAGLWHTDAWRNFVPGRLKGSLGRVVGSLGLTGIVRSLRDRLADVEDAATTRPMQRVVTYGAATGIIVLPLAGVLRFETAALAGAVAVVVSGALTPEAARRAVDWEVVVIVGAVVGYGRALVSTGAVEMVVTGVGQLSSLPASPLAVATGLISAVLLYALAPRRVAASLLPLALSTGLFAISSGGVM